MVTDILLLDMAELDAVFLSALAIGLTLASLVCSAPVGVFKFFHFGR